MLLTRQYFNRFQFLAIAILLLFAVGVGSLQSFMIVKAVRRNT